jgi:hypothetical protein
MTQPRTTSSLAQPSLRAPVLWGVVFGAIQAVVLITVGVHFQS